MTATVKAVTKPKENKLVSKFEKKVSNRSMKSLSSKTIESQVQQSKDREREKEKEKEREKERERER